VNIIVWLFDMVSGLNKASSTNDNPHFRQAHMEWMLLFKDKKTSDYT